MIPNPMFVRYLRPSLTDRASRELRAYARREWDSDVPWLVGSARRATLRARLRGWLRARRPSPGTSHAAAGTPRGEVISSVPLAAPAEECSHPALEDLGFGGSARFLRCAVCGRVLILHDGRRWSLDPAGPATSEGAARG